MTRRRGSIRAACAALLLAAAGCGGAPAPVPLPAPVQLLDPDLALLAFDSAWSRIAHTHYDTAFVAGEWPRVRADLRPEAAAAQTLPQLRAVIAGMLARLGESHFVLIPAEAADALGSPTEVATQVIGDAGLEVRLVDGAMAVSRVVADGPAARAGVRTGWILEAVGGRPLAPRLERLAGLAAAEQRLARMRLLYQVNAELEGDVGDVVVLGLRDAAGRPRDVRLTLRQSPGELVRFGNLPPMRALLEYTALAPGNGAPAGNGIAGGGGGGACVGVIRMNVWMVPLMRRFDEAVDALRGCRGIVLDLRGNPGGVAGMVMGTAGHFLDDTLALGVMRTRTSELRFKANPRTVSAAGHAVRPYAGALAILVDEMSASTSEIFAAGLQGVGRARIFGAQSAGQALPALMVRLPTNDVLMHAIADFTGPGGTRIEGDGVIPDVAIQPDLPALLAGRDAPLDAAITWIESSTRPDIGGRRP